MRLGAVSAVAEHLQTGLQPGQAPNCPGDDSGPGSTPAAGVSGLRACPAGSPSQYQACTKGNRYITQDRCAVQDLTPSGTCSINSGLKNKVKMVEWLVAP